MFWGQTNAVNYNGFITFEQESESMRWTCRHVFCHTLNTKNIMLDFAYTLRLTEYLCKKSHKLTKKVFFLRKFCGLRDDVSNAFAFNFNGCFDLRWPCYGVVCRKQLSSSSLSSRLLQTVNRVAWTSFCTKNITVTINFQTLSSMFYWQCEWIFTSKTEANNKLSLP